MILFMILIFDLFLVISFSFSGDKIKFNENISSIVRDDKFVERMVLLVFIVV